jgi:predicted RNase H-like nuclease (RuvC/YqgF family)
MIVSRNGLFLIASLALFLTMAVAQGRALAEGTMTEDEIRDCMCRERALQNLREETGVQQTKYNDARSRLQSLETQIANMRKTMNPQDDISVQILTEMIRQRDALNTQIRTTIYPETQAAVSKLNAAVTDYNQRCTQRAMLKTDVDNASRNLVCPAAQ